MGPLEWSSLNENLTFEKRLEEGQRMNMQVSEGRYPRQKESQCQGPEEEICRVYLRD